MKTLLLSAILITQAFIVNVAYGQLANLYPNDVGIANDPDVLYVDKFEDGMTNILSRYSGKQNSAGMSLDSDVPPGSPGQYSLKMPIYRDEDLDFGIPHQFVNNEIFGNWQSETWEGVPGASLVNTRSYSNPHSFRFARETAGAGGNMILDIGTTVTSLFIRFYVYFDNVVGWSGMTGGQQNHFLFMGSKVAPTPCVLDIFQQGLGVPGLFFQADGASVSPANGLMFRDFNIKNNLGRWIAVEWNLNLANKTTQLFIDGVKQQPYLGFTSTPASNDSFTVPNISSIRVPTFSMYATDKDTRPAQSYYIDDVVVSSSYIGPRGGGCTAPSPTVSASGPTTLCPGQNVTLNAGSGYNSYSWSNGATTQTIIVSQSGYYAVTVDSAGCSGTSNPVQVQIENPSPLVQANGPSVWCNNKTFLLDAGAGYSSYLWSNGAATQTISVSQSGTYSVTVTGAGGCSGNSQAKTFTVNNGCVTTVLGETSDTDAPGSSQDTYLNIDDNNYSQSAKLNSYTWPANTSANAILIKWNLSSLPPNIQINRADLLLYQIEAGGDALYDITLHKVINKNPDISTATGNTYNGTNAWTSPLVQSDIGPAIDVQTLDTLNGYKAWDATSLVQSWYANPAVNYGMLLNSDTIATSDSYRFFFSSEYNDAAKRPKLVISYTNMTTGITGAMETGGIRVYPNPTTGELRITNDELRMKNAGFGLSTLDFRLFDIYGRVVLEHQQLTTNNQQLDLRHLPAGVYFLTITTGIVTEKVVKY